MLELGNLSREMHATAIRDIFEVCPDVCVLIGPEMTAAADINHLPDAGHPLVLVTSPDSRDAAHIVLNQVRRGDVLLVKGSRGIATEQIIAVMPLPD